MNKKNLKNNNEEYVEIIDKYGNDIDFPDDVAKEVTAKGVIGKWISIILTKMKNALFAYYINENNDAINDKKKVDSLFTDTKKTVDDTMPFLEDLISDNINGFESLIIAMYGISGDETYMMRKFTKLYSKKDKWEEKNMWNNCEFDDRLFNILCSAAN